MVSEGDIVEKVRSIMNEIGEEEKTFLLDEDTIKIDEYIKSCISDALLLLIQNSPLESVNPQTAESIQPTKNADGSGFIMLPDDFVSLICFKMKGWKRSVSVTYPLSSEIYKHQTNEYTRGGINKPVCVLSVNANGKKILEYYSVQEGKEHEIEIFVYEGRYTSGESLNIEKNSRLFSALCYMCASLVYSIFENPNTSKEMQNIALSMISNGVSH